MSVLITPATQWSPISYNYCKEEVQYENIEVQYEHIVKSAYMWTKIKHYMIQHCDIEFNFHLIRSMERHGSPCLRRYEQTVWLPCNTALGG